MTNPYLQLLHSIVDRCALAEAVVGPPQILVVPEEDEPDIDRPGQGNQLQNRIDAAINKAGIAVIVYIEDAVGSEEGYDTVEFRVQVAENPVKNRHESGTRRACWEVLFGLRAMLQGWAPEPAGLWSGFQFLGFDTISKGEMVIREARFNTMIYLQVEQ